MRALFLAGALAVVGASPRADAQELTGVPGISLGFDLKPRAQKVIDAAEANDHFEAVSDTRFRAVRHRESGFLCSFVSFSEAAIDVAPGGDDVSCIESQGGGVMEFQISRFPNASIDELLDNAREHAGGWFEGDIREVEGASALTQSPAPPFVPLDAPRRELTVVGEFDDSPAMLRVAIAQLPNAWFVRQRYYVIFPDSYRDEVEDQAMLGSALAEAVFAARLGELHVPATDPALALVR